MAIRLGDGLANILTGTNGNDQIFGFGGNDTLRGLAGNDFISAGNGDDTVFAGAGDDVVLGGGGADNLFGEAGDDVLIGGAGNDRLVGGNGDDALDGGAGNDILHGGRGADVLEGGDGADSFLFNLLRDSRGGNVDTLLDFNRAEGDKIDLRPLHLDLTGPDRARITFEHHDGDTIVHINTDGHRGDEFTLNVHDNLLIARADLLLV
jgi:Ca2+-binding RTX toxin-like protein